MVLKETVRGTAYPRSGGRVDNIGKWSGRYAKRKAWNKKSRAPSDVQAGCPRASFRDAPCGGRASTGAPFLNPVIWNLHRKNRALPLRGGQGVPGKITGTPHGRSTSPLILSRQCSKLTRNSPCNHRSNVLRNVRDEKSVRMPKNEALLTEESVWLLPLHLMGDVHMYISDFRTPKCENIQKVSTSLFRVKFQSSKALARV